MRVVAQFKLPTMRCFTEPSAVAPDARVNSKTLNEYNIIPKLTLGSGATALGSVNPTQTAAGLAAVVRNTNVKTRPAMNPPMCAM